MMKDLKAFLEELANSEALQTGLADALKNRKLPEFLKENGCDAGPDAFLDYLRKAADENESMSAEEMEAVAGGVVYDYDAETWRKLVHDFCEKHKDYPFVIT